MELNLETDYADRAYTILASLVTPRPIALVTTISADGKVNAAPFSFFNLLGANPPICAFAPGNREDGTPKDTALNVRSTHEFVVNLVDEAIAEAPASLECVEWGTLQIGGNRVVIGLIKRLHLRDELFDVQTKRVRTEKLLTIGRMASPHWYCKTSDRFEMKRPD